MTASVAGACVNAGSSAGASFALKSRSKCADAPAAASAPWNCSTIRVASQRYAA
jgi:hypothetical protein